MQAGDTMYNRYVPQPDGSYRKNRVPEPRRADPPARQHIPRQPPARQPVQEECPPPDRKDCAAPTEKECPQQPDRKQPPYRQDSITGFFRQLLPKDLDTADLLIIILLLLMAGDCEEDRNNALLTLALYFFM